MSQDTTSTSPSTPPPAAERSVLTQNPKYANLPSLLRHYEHRANYYRKQYPVYFFPPTLAFGIYAIAKPLTNFYHRGLNFKFMNLLVFGLFWDWICFSRIFFGNTKGIRRWYLPDDFYEYVPKSQVEEWKARKLEEWREEQGRANQREPSAPERI